MHEVELSEEDENSTELEQMRESEENAVKSSVTDTAKDANKFKTE